MTPLELAESNPKIKELLSALHHEASKHVKTAEALEELMLALLGAPISRPKTWSQNSNAPYYKEKFGRHVKRKIERFLKECPKTSTRGMFINAREEGMSRVSYTNMLGQGWMWLVDNDE